ncbi:MAG: beta-1,6-N-acetylglucosaminyltransferase [Bacteroidaceae bacterium]
MNIAYLISAHTDPAQLCRLVLSLHSDAEFFIHIDAKSRLEQFTSCLQLSRVHYIDERVDVRWGTMREVQYQMNLIRAAVTFPRKFDRIFFLSGMDYPMWSNARIVRWLEQQGEREILQGYCMDTSELDAWQRETYTVARPACRNVRMGILLRKLLRLTGYRKQLHFSVQGNVWHLYKGSAWWCISQELAQFVLDQYDHNADLHRYFDSSFCPAETFIQTIAFNNPSWRSRCILTEGKYPGLEALTPLHFIDYRGAIHVMTEEDYQRLRRSGKMFCRKVVTGKSDSLVSILDRDRTNLR